MRPRGWSPHEQDQCPNEREERGCFPSLLSGMRECKGVTMCRRAFTRTHPRGHHPLGFLPPELRNSVAIRHPVYGALLLQRKQTKTLNMLFHMVLLESFTHDYFQNTNPQCMGGRSNWGSTQPRGLSDLSEERGGPGRHGRRSLALVAQSPSSKALGWEEPSPFPVFAVLQDEG